MTTVDNLFKWFMMNQFYQRLVSSDLHGLQFTLPTLDVFLLPPSNLSITVCRRRRRQFLTATFYFCLIDCVFLNLCFFPLIFGCRVFSPWGFLSSYICIFLFYLNKFFAYISFVDCYVLGWALMYTGFS